MFRLSLLLLLVLLVFHLSATKKFEIEGSGVTLDEYEDEQEEETLTNFTLSPKNSTSSSITRVDDEFLDDFEENFYDESLSSSSSSTSSTLLPPLIRSTPTPTKIRAFFNFIARPPIAAGILVGLSIGILISVILLVCLIRRTHQRAESQSSFTTGLLYPNHYGYAKTPQEFYA